MSGAVYGGLLIILFGASAELTARIQDWITRGIPVLATPDWDRDLFIDTPSGRRGRPNGRYLKWALNDYGFRSAPMRLTPTPGTQRLMLLGASETFGLYESPDHEFPALLDRRLHSRYEVVNAALTGMTLASTISYWNGWARRFAPDVVVIYPSPFFYLNGPDEEDRRSTADVRVARLDGPRLSPAEFDLMRVATGMRMLQRARERLDVPDFIQRWRDDRAIRTATSGRPVSWFFSTPPMERADRLVRDLAILVDAIRRDGARPIVMTHASRVANPLRAADLEWLERARVNIPRAEARVIAQFEVLVNERLVAWAQREDVEVIDLYPVMAGRDELFGDLIHFNDAGASVVAATVADYLDGSVGGGRQASHGLASNAVQ